MPSASDLEPVLRGLRAGEDPRFTFNKYGVDPAEVMSDPDLAEQVKRAYEVGTGWLVTQATLRGVLGSDALLAKTLAARDPRFADPSRNVHVGIGLGNDVSPGNGQLEHRIVVELAYSDGAGGPLQDEDGRPVLAIPGPDAAL